MVDGADDQRVNEHALVEVAELSADAKQLDQAIVYLKRFRKIASERGQKIDAGLPERALYRLAACEYQLEHWSECASTSEEFIQANPDSNYVASTSLIAAESLIHLAKPTQALKHLDRLVERFPADPGYRVGLLRRGETLATLQRWSDSESAFAAFLHQFSRDEQWFTAQFGVGWARENQGRFDEAALAYRDVVARHQGPTAARAQFQIGECLFASKQYEQAAAELIKVDILYAYPEWSAAALYEAGRCFQKLTKPEEARGQFATVVDKFGQTKWAPMAAKLLAEMSASARGSQ